MSREKLGSLIGAAFGLVFVLVNTSSMAAALAVVLRALGVVTLTVHRSPRPGRRRSGENWTPWRPATGVPFRCGPDREASA